MRIKSRKQANRKPQRYGPKDGEASRSPIILIYASGVQPGLGQHQENGREPVQPVSEGLIAGQLGKPVQQVVFGVLVNRLLRESPLADAPQVYRNTLLICKLGTEIVALALHLCFYYATIVADSAIERYEICLPHTYILCSFALFVYTFLLLIRIFYRPINKSRENQ